MKYLVLFLLPLALFAHRLNIVVYDDGDSITLKGYYSAKSVCRNCKVEIKASGFDKVYKTSEKGLLSLQKSALPKGVMNISINGGDGHFEQMQYQLDESSLPPSVAKSAPDQNINPTTTGNAKADSSPKHRKVARSRPEIRAVDIGAGIGYVFGIFGVIALIISRKKSKT